MTKNKIILMDGANGTNLWKMAEKRGIPKDPVWKYNIEHPELVAELATAYADAGSQIIMSNTFDANVYSVKRCSTYTVQQVVKAGVRIAKETVGRRGVQIAMDVGPLSVLMEPYGDLTEEEVKSVYREQIGAGVEAGADLIQLETFMDLEMMKAAVQVAKEFGLPVLTSMSFEKHCRTLMGNSVEQIVAELEPLQVDGVGLNCSQGPQSAVAVIREFAEKTKLPLIFKPNAGKPQIAPDGTMILPYEAENFAEDVAPVLSIVTYLGGCCGSNPDYIRALNKRIND